MKRIDSDDPDILVYREPAYGSWVISIPFYAGLVALGLGFGVPILKEMIDRDSTPPLLLLFALGFAAFLLYKAIATPLDWFSRRGCRIDRKTGEVTAEGGLFLPQMFANTVPLRTFNRLRIHGWRQVGENSGTVFRTEWYLDLCGPHGAYVRLGRSSDESELQRMADDISSFISGPKSPERLFPEYLARMLAQSPPALSD